MNYAFAKLVVAWLYFGLICSKLMVAIAHVRPFVKSVYQKIFFLFLNQNICCGHPKHMLKLMGKKIFTILLSKFLFKPVKGFFPKKIVILMD